MPGSCRCVHELSFMIHVNLIRGRVGACCAQREVHDLVLEIVGLHQLGFHKIGQTSAAKAMNATSTQDAGTALEHASKQLTDTRKALEGAISSLQSRAVILPASYSPVVSAAACEHRYRPTLRAAETQQCRSPTVLQYDRAHIQGTSTHRESAIRCSAQVHAVDQPAG